MTFKRLNSYKGRLSATQIAQGMNVAARNAQRLNGDAKLLLENGRFPSAASLAILAIEEAGKLSILRGLSIAPDEKILKSSWKDYRTHTAKNTAWIIVDLVSKGAKELDDFRPMFDRDSDHTVILDALKQIGFYTDCLGNAHWSEPHEIIDGALAKGLVDIAQMLVPTKETCVREIELWVQHVAPHWGTGGMAHGALRFYDALRDEGIDTSHDPEEIRRFFGVDAFE